MTETHIYKFFKKKEILSKSHGRISKKRLGKSYDRILNIIYKWTSFAPKNSTISFRIKLLKFGLINKTSLDCPICSSILKERRNGNGFALTCGAGDKEHLDYIKKVQIKRSKKNQYSKVSKESSNSSRVKTMLLRYGVKYPMQHIVFKQRYMNNLLSKYGVNNSAKIKGSAQKAKITNLTKYGYPHYNQKSYKPNYFLLNSKLIENNFISKEGFFLSEEFQRFVGCKKTASFDIVRSFGIKFYSKNGCFNPDKPAKLYYIWDARENLYKIGITNRTVYERFGKSFLEERNIKILREVNYTNGQDAYLAEQEILEAFSIDRCTNESWPEDKGGKTEFFNRDILDLHNI